MSTPPNPDRPAPASNPQRAWFVGGTLLLLAIVAEVGLRTTGGGAGLVRDVMLAAALLVFALGLGGGGSVTARRPLGTAALIALALSVPAVPVLISVIAPSGAPIEVLTLITQLSLLVQVALALIAVAQIGRVAVVPRPWNWAPAWAVAAVGLSAAVQAAASVIVTQNAQAIFLVLVTVDAMIRVSVLLGLGVLAIVLGDRAGR